MAADFALAAAPVGSDLTVEGFAVALMAMAFAVIGFAIATSMTGSSSLAILATHSFTIPIGITDTIPTDIILTVTDTVVLAAVASVAVAFATLAFAAVAFAGVAFVAVAFAAAGDPYIIDGMSDSGTRAEADPRI